MDFMNQIEDLKALQNECISVWGQQQEVLEEQALQELQIYNENLSQEKEEGELSDDNVEKVDSPKMSKQFEEAVSLDVNSYIKRQEELKKRQEYNKSLLVSEISDKSKQVATIISDKQCKKTKRKRKKSIETVEVNHKKVRIETNGNVEEDINGGNEVEEKSGSEYVPSDIDSDYEPGFNEAEKVSQRKPRTAHKKSPVKVEQISDDGSLKHYKKRLAKYYEALELENKIEAEESGDVEDSVEYVEIKQGFKLQKKIWYNLYSYQQEGVKWLWDLHKKCTGALLGDEMGLGKTVQVIAFLAALDYNRVISNHGRYTGLGPTIIVCPSTVLHQWVQHFFQWAPEFRVAVLHQSGSFAGDKTQLIKEMNKNKGIIITTYQSILKHKKYLMQFNWHYVILDEGHKIRNPDAKISVAVKEFHTPYRLILTGSPMQNNLQELWSLFDFVVPDMLGTLPVFIEHFASPIMQGGYMNASPTQEALALSIATALKNMITPYMLRRAKADVKDDICLPNKSEQVLFCSLSKEQRDLYKGFLMSEHMCSILGKSNNKNWFGENHTRAKVLMAITTLRKICNHPQIYLSDVDTGDEEPEPPDVDDYKRSGKMIVVSALLKIWKKQQHRVLLFTQSRSMIKIFETFLPQQGYKHMKMDGTTSVKSRQPLIDKFNSDNSYDIFLLTTRVGGLGVNLTGANRVIIFDPDWNPATDTQARERAWRIGQDKEVTIYRLISAGTIEEKMYQRQVWKQLLSNKVLLDPKTQKFFKTSDLHDLFSLQEDTSNQPETANIFKNSRVQIEERIKEKKKKKHKHVDTITFSDDKIEKMKQLAAQIAKNITKKEPDKLTLDQIDVQEERAKKLEERAELKKLTPMELRQYNRDKLKQDDPHGNQLDDCETDVSFTKALVISEKTAELYNDVKACKKKVDDAVDTYSGLTKVFAKPKKKKHKVIVDKSGNIDGERVDGLLKTETTKNKIKSSSSTTETVESQDNYVLNKLFSKKGIHSALQHDAIVESNFRERNSIKVHSETQIRTDLALNALTKSRANKWRW